MNEAKAWWQSKTIWFNALVLALATAETQLHLLSSVLPGKLFTWLAFVLPVGNAALRFLTTTVLTPTRAQALAINEAAAQAPDAAAATPSQQPAS